MAQTSQNSSQWEWRLVKAAVFVFPLIPELGGLGLLIATIQILRQHFFRIIKQPIIKTFGVVSLWLIFTCIVSPRPLDAFLGLGNFFPFFLVFMSVSDLIKTPSHLRQLAWQLVIPSVAVFWLGVGQLFLGWGVPPALDPIISADLPPYGDPVGRMSSVFMYANILAFYFLMVFIIGIGLTLDLYQQWLFQPSSKNRALLIFVGSTVLSNGVGLLLTNSRNAWGLAFLACVVFALYLGWRSLVAICAVLASSIAIASWGPSPLKEGFRQIVPAYFWARLSDELYQRPYALLRTTQWKFAGQMMLDRPLTGWGLRNFSPMYKAQMKLWLGHPHNLFLMFLGEIGIIGTILFCSWVGWILFKGVLLYLKLCSLSTVKNYSGQLMLFTYLLAFSEAILFNCFDLSVFDGKANTFGWLILAAITGIVLSSENFISNYKNQEVNQENLY
ncbi:O-antigen ligase [Chroococcus sp. FPU101]|uniref:O-antigen ligase family protein n=1 Tax=Chroococcus sp. FPU101 TaxID=1974212 RepID=UPI001A8F05CF|nr:O-antigen ligase family protein [Chroococcus sp. FPU101]GFE68870.1 O-antigen polymerase [Chroococcus sp. FPU101]